MTAAEFTPWMEHAGIAVGAISGVLAAKGKEIDLFGVLVLALAAAFGGGTTRDLLAGDTPVTWLRGPEQLTTAILTAMITFFAARWIRMPQGLLQIADAVSLAFFVMLGMSKGLSLSFSGPVAVMLGVITGIAGGIVRDVLLGEVPSVLRREIRLYATAAIAGGAVNLLLRPAGGFIAAPAGFATVLVLRLAAMRWRISLPVFKARE